MSLEVERQGLWDMARKVLETVTFHAKSPVFPSDRPTDECLIDLLPASYQAEAKARAARNAAFQGLTDFAQNRQSTDFSPSGARFMGTAELQDQYTQLRAAVLEAGGTQDDIANVVGVGRVVRDSSADAVFRNNLRLNGQI